MDFRWSYLTSWVILIVLCLWIRHAAFKHQKGMVLILIVSGTYLLLAGYLFAYGYFCWCSKYDMLEDYAYILIVVSLIIDIFLILVKKASWHFTIQWIPFMLILLAMLRCSPPILPTKQKVNINDKIVSVYLEKQTGNLSMLHALNSLFQKSQYTQKDLEDICHFHNITEKAFIGGNYSMKIAQLVLKQNKWKLTKTSLPLSNAKNILGYLLYLPPTLLLRPVNHLIAIKYMKNQWMWLDSRTSPKAYTVSQLREKLNKLIQNQHAVLYKVHK